jgi:Transposase DDE domain
LRLPSIERILVRYQDRLATKNKSTFSYCLRRARFVAFAEAMLEHLALSFKPKRSDVIALDSMGITISKRRKSNAAKINDKTRGIFVVWQFIVDSGRGCVPVKLLKIVHSACNDGHHIQSVRLLKGPIYLMDRGFYCFDAIRGWIAQKVRFIVRAKKSQCIYEAIKVLGKPRAFSGGFIQFDGIVWLGRKKNIKVRLVYAIVKGQDLILVSNLMDYSAENLLGLYKKRWQIERFHRFLKQMCGLAHLYNFQKEGMELLLRICLIAAILLFLQASGQQATVDTLIQQLNELRAMLGIEQPLRRNSCTRHWKKKSAKSTSLNH